MINWWLLATKTHRQLCSSAASLPGSPKSSLLRRLCRAQRGSNQSWTNTDIQISSDVMYATLFILFCFFPYAGVYIIRPLHEMSSKQLGYQPSFSNERLPPSAILPPAGCGCHRSRSTPEEPLEGTSWSTSDPAVHPSCWKLVRKPAWGIYDYFYGSLSRKY